MKTNALLLLALLAAAVAAMRTPEKQITLNPLNNVDTAISKSVAVGQKSAFSQATVPVGAKRVILVFNSAFVAEPESRMLFGVEISRDNGASWLPYCESSRPGTQPLDELGNPATTFGMGCSLAPSDSGALMRPFIGLMKTSAAATAVSGKLRFENTDKP